MKKSAEIPRRRNIERPLTPEFFRSRMAVLMAEVFALMAPAIAHGQSSLEKEQLHLEHRSYSSKDEAIEAAVTPLTEHPDATQNLLENVNNDELTNWGKIVKWHATVDKEIKLGLRQDLVGYPDNYDKWLTEATLKFLADYLAQHPGEELDEEKATAMIKKDPWGYLTDGYNNPILKPRTVFDLGYEESSDHFRLTGGARFDLNFNEEKFLQDASVYVGAGADSVQLDVSTSWHGIQELDLSVMPKVPWIKANKNTDAFRLGLNVGVGHHPDWGTFYTAGLGLQMHTPINGEIRQN